MTILIKSNEEMEDMDMIKLVRSLKDFGYLKKVTKTIENETKKQIGVFLGTLLRTSSANLLGNMLAVKGVIATIQGRGIVTAGYGVVQAGVRVIRAGQELTTAVLAADVGIYK